MNYAYYNILDNDYNPEFVGPVLVITGRDKDGNFRKIRCLDDKFRPHFFVLNINLYKIIIIIYLN